MNIVSEKAQNAIAYFAMEHKKVAKSDLTHSFLYKYLALLDFRCLQRFGTKSLDLTYNAMQWGPVNLLLYENRDNLSTHFFTYERIVGETYRVVAKAQPNLNLFSPAEIGIMKNLVKEFASDFVPKKSLQRIEDATHKEIRAWQSAWNNPSRSNDCPVMKEEDEFKDIADKTWDELTIEEENFLTGRILANRKLGNVCNRSDIQL